MKYKDERSCLIDSNLNRQKQLYQSNRKTIKYKDLEIEIERMWGMKTKTIPIVIGALGVIKKGSKKYLDDIPANIQLQDLQKTTLLDTARMLRKILSMK